jgi:stage II sporulation SpoE-like protein
VTVLPEKSTMTDTIYRITEGKAVEGWTSVDNSRSEEEQRWLSEGERTEEAYPESGDIPLPGLGLERSPANDALIRNLTWRFRAAEARERERIEQELQVARQIQQELLPETIPKLEGWRIEAYYGPAREVGGDFYDFLEFSDGRLGLVVGDATGHGIPAALVMATTRGMLKSRRPVFGVAGRGIGTGQRGVGRGHTPEHVRHLLL